MNFTCNKRNAEGVPCGAPATFYTQADSIKSPLCEEHGSALLERFNEGRAQIYPYRMP